MKIYLLVSTKYTKVTDWQTDRRTDTVRWHRPRLCIASHGYNIRLVIIITFFLPGPLTDCPQCSYKFIVISTYQSINSAQPEDFKILLIQRMSISTADFLVHTTKVYLITQLRNFVVCDLPLLIVAGCFLSVPWVDRTASLTEWSRLTCRTATFR